MRKQEEINNILIHGNIRKDKRWLVDIVYTDGAMARGLWIDYSDNINMLDEVLKCLKLQLASEQSNGKN